MWFTAHKKKLTLPTPEEALPGRDQRVPVPDLHYVKHTPLTPPFPDGFKTAVFALGCFWGAERAFWQIQGVFSTAAGYVGGTTPNPTYEEVCSGMTGHTEAVLVVYDPAVVSYADLLKLFWERHDPTQGMRQGNDVGTQYRSGLYTTSPEQRQASEAAKADYEAALRANGFGAITTEIVEGATFYYAEAYHQQYLAKNPGGYCGLGGTGVSCPAARRPAAEAAAE